MAETGTSKEVFPILTGILTSLEKITDAVHQHSSEASVLSLFDEEIRNVTKLCLKITPNQKDFSTINQILSSIERMADSVYQISSKPEVTSKIDAELSQIARLCGTIPDTWA